MRNEYTLSLDLKKRMSHVTPIFLQHDAATLYFRVYDKGAPFNLKDVERIEVSHLRGDGKVIVGFGKKHTFSDGAMGIKYDYLGSEMNYAGDVQTSVSMFTSGSKEKVSTLPFTVKIVTDTRDYAVEDVGAFTEIMKEATQLLEDLYKALGTANSTTAEMKATIVTANNRIARMDEQLALIAGAIDRADTATQDAISATTKSLEQTQKALQATQDAINATNDSREATDKAKLATQETLQATQATIQATLDSIEATNNSIAVKDATEAVRVATEQERADTEQVRVATDKVKEDTLTVKEDTLKVKEDTELLKSEVESLKIETEQAKDESIEATERSIDATLESIEATSEAKKATEDSKIATQNSITATQESIATKDATEAVRANTETVRVATELVKTETEKVRDETKILYEDVNTLKGETELAKNETIVATQKANDASDLIVEKVQEYDDYIYDYEYLLQYDPNKSYKKHNQVYFGRNSYIAIKDVPTGNSPPIEKAQLGNEYWNMFAIGGIDGEGSVSSVNGVSPDPTTFDVDLRTAKQMEITEPILSQLSSKNIAISDTAPSSPKEGDFWVSFDDDKVD